ncbi:cyclopropane-fatty-acyl-phospholipid synthase family protein [Candidatus Binatia bacterium]|nr:cyclopropane-fatty-acyl-phospholipid synthase family protein [Candidatus Binatia bacterium]
MTSTDRRSLDAQAIEHHYDLSNDFYALFLDPLMVYTCAYYRTPETTLAQAQADKLDLVCRKLRLAPGERFLDVGCGWGSLAIWAAKHYGVQALGVTLSREQVAYAKAWIAREGLEHLCRVEHRDYRDLVTEDSFDKISAIGIIEHVGIANYRAYFEEIYGLLRPGGLFLNHGITRNHYWERTPQWDFLVEHVFPNGELDTVSHISTVLEEARFEISDVECLREHYARTCRAWAERLLAHAEHAIALVGKRKYRTWLLYLHSSAVGFEQASIGLHQIVALRRDPSVRGVPTTRESIYTETPARIPGRAA